MEEVPEEAAEAGDGDVNEVLRMLVDEEGVEKGQTNNNKSAANNTSSKEEFDRSQLLEKVDVLAGEEADVWTDSMEEIEQLKVIALKENMETNLLPAVKRRKGDGDVRGSSAQSFDLDSDPKGEYTGYAMGQLFLPPGGMKDPESVGDCAQLFTVCAGQEGYIEIAYYNPNETAAGGPWTSQQFLLGPRDQFRIPPGNTYRVRNHSSKVEAVLAWVIIRPPIPAWVGEDETENDEDGDEQEEEDEGDGDEQEMDDGTNRPQ